MFVGNLADKSYGDLIAFLEQDLAEGVRLDDKSAFPGNLAKTLAAMANTDGGLILIGVGEDDNRPGA